MYPVVKFALFQGVQEDIETMQSTVDSINEVVNIFLPKADKTFGRQLKSEQDEMNAKWTKLVDLSLKHNNKLVEDLERTRAVVVETQKLDKWIDSITKEYLAREYTVHSDEELEGLIDKFAVRRSFKKSQRFLFNALLSYFQVFN